jgi:hypothetical protein
VRGSALQALDGSKGVAGDAGEGTDVLAVLLREFAQVEDFAS